MSAKAHQMIGAWGTACDANPLPRFLKRPKHACTRPMLVRTTYVQVCPRQCAVAFGGCWQLRLPSRRGKKSDYLGDAPLLRPSGSPPPSYPKICHTIPLILLIHTLLSTPSLEKVLTLIKTTVFHLQNTSFGTLPSTPHTYLPASTSFSTQCPSAFPPHDDPRVSPSASPVLRALHHCT